MMFCLDSFIIVAVDGGAASGKSSTSHSVAERLNLLHVDTGSHYRAVTFLCLRHGTGPEDENEVGRFLRDVELEVKIDGNDTRIRIGGSRLLEHELRNPEVNGSVSQFAALPTVRQFVLTFQRSLADLARVKGFDGLIMDGRDIGSVIFPNADIKFFLTATPEARSLRRQKEGISDSIVERDKIDSSRKTAPLVCPKDAIRIDSSDLSLEAVVNLICDRIATRFS